MQPFHPKAPVLKPAGWVRRRDAVPCAQGDSASPGHSPLCLPRSSPPHPGNTHPQASDWQFFLFPFLLLASSNPTQNSPISPHPVVPAPDAVVLTLTHHQGFRERQTQKVWPSQLEDTRAIRLAWPLQEAARLCNVAFGWLLPLAISALAALHQRGDGCPEVGLKDTEPHAAHLLHRTFPPPPAIHPSPPRTLCTHTYHRGSVGTSGHRNPNPTSSFRG